MDPIGRKSLSHEIPDGAAIGSEEEVFFITIVCVPRGENQLARPETWKSIDETLRIRELAGDLKVRLVLAMPDHLHGLISFGGVKPMKKVITDLKSWLAKCAGVRWQRDFFDHRIRSWESGAEKAAYIQQNPVRAGFVERSEDWPYQR